MALSRKELDLLQSLIDQVSQIAQHIGLTDNPAFATQQDKVRGRMKDVRAEVANTTRST